MSEIKSFIAAGGSGSRLSLGYPKAGLKYHGHTLLYWSVVNMLDAGLEFIQIFVNHPDWLSRFQEEMNQLPHLHFMLDKGFNNTFQLFKIYSSTQGGRHFFTYGHSPRPVKCYKRFAASNTLLGISLVPTTSKAEKIEYSPFQFIEPPYLLNCDQLNLEANSWKHFFYNNCKFISPIINHLIPEFNFRHEWLQYRYYLHTQRIAV
ncbi:hypothetical protein A4D02_14315 [Niastella koreensis]|uniref:MobA-like NTP transferase domain-containing protein n=2 Tax=Niastella koreensis TaxID=354356 RepID=G8TRK1_NIAKG|nr:hypothetical protein [Niastella koreensis]AEW01132.1 hypothetical protein Niako_4890 [Niastella koreensis GR20-10]OQP40667.1 hypothetical protein A4D02_14315 [Niastella koreensis]